MSSAESLIETGLRSALTAGTALVGQVGGTAAPRIYNHIAPPASTLPYIVYTLVGGGDLNDTPTRAGEWLYQVGVFGTALAQCGTIDGYVEDLLNGGSVSISGWSNYWCARESPYRLSETVGKVTVYHVGAVYRVGATE